MAVQNAFYNLLGVLETVRLVDILDVAIVAFLLYHAVVLMRETRAMQLVKGIAAVLALYFVADLLNMITLRFIMQSIVQVGIVVLIVLFQPEFRRALEQMGRTKIGGIGRLMGTAAAQANRQDMVDLIDMVGDSCASLSQQKTGALLVFERETKLGEIVGTGTVIDSRASKELIENIFFTNSPMHDGAMVVRGSRLYAAGCYLPLSSNMEIGRELGTRHRAALGMSEVSDAIVVVVSEETGAITVAMDSRLQRGLSAQNLKKLLTVKLIGSPQEEDKPSKKIGFWRKKK